MPTQSWPAPAKLNLFLHITGRRADGSHELQTLFQLLEYSDALWFEVLTDSNSIERHSGTAQSLAALPADQDICVQAARLLQLTTQCKHGVRIRVEKRIPIGAGLGGGSSDAATTLVALNRLWQLNLSQKDLMDLGLRLGADVPFFIQGKSAWAEGVGEKLTPMDLPDRWYWVIYPGQLVSTAEIYAAKNLTRDQRPITIADFLDGGAKNVMTPVVCAQYPVVQKAIDWLTAQNLGDVSMSGSGSSVFVAVDNAKQVKRLQAEPLPAGWSGFVARTLNTSPLIQL